MKLSATTPACIGLAILSQLALADAPPQRYAIATDRTVTDNRTKLIWQRDVNPGNYSQAAAKTLCEGLGNGWRLPTRAELVSIVDPTRHSPSIDVEAFPSTASMAFWTASACPGSSGGACVINFSDGSSNSDSYGASYALPVRCVR